jgi:hypothetical protein
MHDLLKWLETHWTELLSYLGLGGGSGFLAKKLVDKAQDQKIKSLEHRIGMSEADIVKLKSDIEINTLFDKDFRVQVADRQSELKEDMKEVKGRLDQIFNHLLNQKA